MMQILQPSRFRDTGATLSSFVSDPILIVCPRCDSRAVVTPVHEDDPEQWARIIAFKLTCPTCALTQTADYHLQLTLTHDPVFRARLWLQTRTRHGDLFVYNEQHLSVLERFATATLRERLAPHSDARPKYGWHNASMISRLPKWMKTAKNRDELLSACSRLRTML
jgi:hypothetical protein